MKNEIALNYDDRSDWRFPPDYARYLVLVHGSLVGASTNPFDSNVTEPVRKLVIEKFPELKSDRVNTLVGVFLTKIRTERRRIGTSAGVMPLASQHKKRQGGKGR